MNYTFTYIETILTNKLSQFGLCYNTLKSLLMKKNIEYISELINLYLWFYDKYEYDYITGTIKDDEMVQKKISCIFSKEFENVTKYQYVINDSIVSSNTMPANEHAILNLVSIHVDQYCLNRTQALTRLPKEIDLLRNLQSLTIRNANIIFLQQGLSKLKSLRHLDLSNNSIKILTKSICNLKKLEFLNISGNYLKELPDELMNLTNLKYLDFSDNSYVKISDTLRNWLLRKQNTGEMTVIFPELPESSDYDYNHDALEYEVVEEFPNYNVCNTYGSYDVF